ncbi:MAG TPA: DUF2461 domain-containing protein [Acidimicrobiia bacterium]|nr:DUF2461 domain-containing protein [Acidimicrobiia bacterium]
MAGFAGFPPEALAFWEGLEADNSKAYWSTHKADYDRWVRGPMQELIKLCADLGPFHIFRPYRDVRFAKDKTPYKTHIGAVTEAEGGGLYYVQLSAQGLFAAAGYHQMASDQLERYREAVAGEPGVGLEAVVLTLEAARYEIGGAALKVAPRGYPRDHPRVRLLRHKGVTMGRSFPVAKWLHTRAALDRVRRVWADSEPLQAWLDRHVGPSRRPPDEERF